MLWRFIYGPNENIMCGTARRVGKTYFVVELIWILILSYLGKIDLKSDKIKTLEDKSIELERDYNIMIALPAERQINEVYRSRAIKQNTRKIREYYPDLNIKTPGKEFLIEVEHNDKRVIVDATGLDPRTAEIKRGNPADILIIDEIASVDIEVVQEVLYPMVEDAEGMTLVVGSSKKLDPTKRAGSVGGYRQFRKIHQSTENHEYIKYTIDDVRDARGKPILNKKRILQRCGGDESNTIYQQEYMVNDEVEAEGSIFKYWNKRNDNPHDIDERNPLILSADPGRRDPYGIILWRWAAANRVNVVGCYEYEQLHLDTILEEMKDNIKDLSQQQLSHIFLPSDSRQKKTTSYMSDAGMWRKFELAPSSRSKIYTGLVTTEATIRQSLSIINNVRIDVKPEHGADLLEERLINATFTTTEKEYIYHDINSHITHAIFCLLYTSPSPRDS